MSIVTIITIVLTLCPSGPISAQIEVVGSLPYEGVAPLAIAVDGSGVIYVPDLYVGVTYRFDPSTGPLAPIPSPGGERLHTGLAYNSDNDRLYWADSTASELHETDLEGTVLGSHPMSTPKAGGIVGGMTYDASTQTLWCIDALNDEIFEMATDGTLTATPPIPMPTGNGSFGLGIAWLPGVTGARFDLLCGSAEDGRVSRIVRLDGDGKAVPCSGREVRFLGDFISGLALKPGSGDTVYMVDNGALAILEVRAAGSASVCPPEGLSCAAGGGGVELSWTPAGHTAVEVWRDHALLETMSGDDSFHLDETAPAGATVLYEVIGLSGGERSYPSTCRVAVPNIIPPSLPKTDGFGYRMEDAGDLVFADISSTGSSLELPSGDDASVEVPIGFVFSFYGSSFETVSVGTNGLIVLGGSAREPSNTGIPMDRLPNGVIAPFWDDLEVSEPGGAIFTELRGTGPGRILIVQWSRVQFYPADADEPNGDLNFQVILHEGTGEVDLIWGRLRGPDTDLACGASATVGVESPDGGTGILYSFRSCAVPEGSAVRILPPGPPAVDDLTCTAEGESLSLSWQNMAAYSAIEIQGDLEATLPGGAESHGFDGLAPGTYRVCVVGFDGDRPSGSACCVVPVQGRPRFLRGDATADGSINLADPIAVLLLVFADMPVVPCLEAADFDDSDKLDLADVIHFLRYIFVKGPPPKAPFADPPDPAGCAPDPTPPAGEALGCESFALCEGEVE